MNSTLIQTDRFALSETERSAIEHEMHHYEDRARRPSKP